MRCANCGKQLPDNAKFCGDCGVKTKKNPKKKKTPLWLRLAVIGAAAIIGTLLGKGMVAPAIAPDAAEETVSNVVVRETISLPQAEYNGADVYQNGVDAYTSFFNERYIVDGSRVSFMLDSFAGVMMIDDFIMKQEIGYKDDIVQELVWTYYYDLSSLSEEEKQTAGSDIQTAFEEMGFGSLDFASVECNVGYQYCRVTIMLKELDNTANLRALANVETVGEAYAGVDYISASKTIAKMPEEGFICKE